MPQINFAVFKVGGVCIGDTDVTRALTVPMDPTRQGATLPVRPLANVLKKMTTVLRMGHAWALQVLAYPGLRRAKSVQALIQPSPVEGMPKAVAERFVTGSYRL